jgi:SAM-dependent methyltransferase
MSTLASSTLAALRRRLRLGARPRAIDQRSGLFAPHGAWLYARVAPTVLAPLFDHVAADTGPILARLGRVLEIDAGPGALSVKLARAFPTALVTGVDLAPAMISASNARAARAGIDERLHFELASGAALPYPVGSVDVVVSTLSLHHWEHPADVFAKNGRVLAPGGQALIYDLRPVAYSGHEIPGFISASTLRLTALEPLGRLFVRITLEQPRPNYLVFGRVETASQEPGPTRTCVATSPPRQRKSGSEVGRDAC